MELKVGRIINLLDVVGKRMLQWFGHVVKQSVDSLARAILEGMVDCKCSRGRPEKSWMINIIKWTGVKVVELIKKTRDREARKSVE